ncbi:MAG TPA: hypothetical protein VGQ57_10125, partial [Polyangiaceae bacterium]|nr:hypothetical protein [Polyangiaceae bacterium]
AAAGLVHLVRERRLDPAALGQQVWQAFEAAGMPDAEAGAVLSAGLAELVLPAAPAAVLRAIVPSLLALGDRLVLTPSQWVAVLASDLTRVPAALFRRVPDTLVEVAVDAACRSGHREGLSLLWARSGAALTQALVDELLAARPAGTRRLLLETAPPEVTPEILGRLPEPSALLRGPAASLHSVRRFLHARVAERSHGFRDAYRLLDELEERLAGVRSEA